MTVEIPSASRRRVGPAMSVRADRVLPVASGTGVRGPVSGRSPGVVSLSLCPIVPGGCVGCHVGVWLLNGFAIIRSGSVRLGVGRAGGFLTLLRPEWCKWEPGGT